MNAVVVGQRDDQSLNSSRRSVGILGGHVGYGVTTQKSVSPDCLVVVVLRMPLTYVFPINILGHLCLYELTSPSGEVS